MSGITDWITTSSRQAVGAPTPQTGIDLTTFAPTGPIAAPAVYRDSRLYWLIEDMTLIVHKFVASKCAVQDALRILTILQEVDEAARTGEADAAIELRREEALQVVQRMYECATSESPLCGKALVAEIKHIFPEDRPGIDTSAFVAQGAGKP